MARLLQLHQLRTPMQQMPSSSFSGYLWRKPIDLADFASTSVSGVSDLNVGIFRFAELLLIYAEAKIEDNDIDNTVFEAINKIRRRALMPELPAGLTQSQLRGRPCVTNVKWSSPMMD